MGLRITDYFYRTNKQHNALLKKQTRASFDKQKKLNLAFTNKQTIESSDCSLVCQLLAGSVCCERGMVLLQGGVVYTAEFSV